MQSEILLVGGITLSYLILFLYLVPLVVAVDEDNPQRWYYPCVCGCLRRREYLNDQIEEDDEENR